MKLYKIDYIYMTDAYFETDVAFVMAEDEYLATGKLKDYINKTGSSDEYFSQVISIREYDGKIVTCNFKPRREYNGV